MTHEHEPIVGTIIASNEFDTLEAECACGRPLFALDIPQLVWHQWPQRPIEGYDETTEDERHRLGY